MRACVFPNEKHRLCLRQCGGGGAIVPTAIYTIIPGMNKKIECNFNGFWKFCSCCAVGMYSTAQHICTSIYILMLAKPTVSNKFLDVSLYFVVVCACVWVCCIYRCLWSCVICLCVCNVRVRLDAEAHVSACVDKFHELAKIPFKSESASFSIDMMWNSTDHSESISHHPGTIKSTYVYRYEGFSHIKTTYKFVLPLVRRKRMYICTLQIEAWIIVIVPCLILFLSFMQNPFKVMKHASKGEALEKDKFWWR